MIVIKAEELGKRYVIGQQRAEGYLTIRDTLSQKFESIKNRVLMPILSSTRQHRATSDVSKTFWALKDLSFEVAQGERVGIIGRNGAGKTTVLKILSRITEPTKGRLRIKGRMASLLEVGTGFHPELTGSENIFLNGAILGMSRAEIKGKFDEIVDFAGVHQFIDTPVKRYSSGMYVRLAFAVAAHLDCEILAVDEVLAVGDMEFQKKCLGKMSDFAEEGRTVLFVSHNMGAIATLCKRGIWLDEGKLMADGPAPSVVGSYLSEGAANKGRKVWAKGDGPGNQSFRLVAVTLRDASGACASKINISDGAKFEIDYEVTVPGTRVVLSLNLFDANGAIVFGSLSNTEGNSYHGKPLEIGLYRSTCSLVGNLLNSGRFYVTIVGTTLSWSNHFTADYVLSFDALEDGILKRDYPGSYLGAVRPKLEWSTAPVETEALAGGLND